MLKEKQNLGSTILRFIQKNLIWLGRDLFCICNCLLCTANNYLNNPSTA